MKTINSTNFASLKVSKSSRILSRSKSVPITCLMSLVLCLMSIQINAQWTSTGTLTKQTTTTNDVLIGGSSLTGAGVKCFWNNSKGAFRGGNATGANWDTINLGDYSFAFGSNVEASGSNGATAFGSGTKATGVNGSTALGLNNTASGVNGATALGFATIASGDIGATALGYASRASGDIGATALGRFTIASGAFGASAIGHYTTASGDFGATAIGNSTEAAGDNSICIGAGVNITTKLVNIIDESLMVGFKSTVPTFFVGPSQTTTSSGFVGIGTTTPTHDLHVAGDIAVAGQIVHPSDKNLKENIHTITNGLSTINQLSPKSYTHKADKAAEFGLSTKPQFGLIAQEVEKVLPELVIQKALVGEDGEIYKGLDYEKLIPILVAAVKELSVENESLKTINKEQLTINQIQTTINKQLLEFMESQQSLSRKLSGLSGSK